MVRLSVMVVNLLTPTFYLTRLIQIFGRPTKPKSFISNFKSRALFHFRFLSPSKIWICSSFLLSLSLSNSPWICRFFPSLVPEMSMVVSRKRFAIEQLWWNP
ncbi:hypothetical protein HanPSC8_Chr15g0653821 [Helianthus annuus]|nr:hypothetical protein HanPSC8_Chr15g0653821 [Helianthus annuus]